MEKHLTPEEAFRDFFEWLKNQDTWKGMKRTEKQYIYRARKEQERGRLGPVRMENLFDRYAPGRYVKSTYYIINE